VFEKEAVLDTALRELFGYKKHIIDSLTHVRVAVYALINSGLVAEHVAKLVRPHRERIIKANREYAHFQ